MARKSGTTEQVREHLKRFTKREHMGKAHEAKETPGFERKEQRLLHGGASTKK